MCKLNKVKSTGAVQNRSLFMFSVEAFSGHKGGVPGAMAQCSTGAVVVLFLIAVEMTLRQFFTSIKVRECNENLVYSRMLSRNNSKSNSHVLIFVSLFILFRSLLGLPSNIGR